MTIILLICSVAVNLLLFAWIIVIWVRLEEWKKAAKEWMEIAEEWRNRFFVTLESPSTPGISTESPTPAPDAD